MKKLTVLYITIIQAEGIRGKSDLSVLPCTRMCPVYPVMDVPCSSLKIYAMTMILEDYQSKVSRIDTCLN